MASGDENVTLQGPPSTEDVPLVFEFELAQSFNKALILCVFNAPPQFSADLLFS